MSYKICVYAICKNEEKFVDRWISAFIDKVDYIRVLDTGSTDNTVEKLKSYGPKVVVNQKIYKNFRFDVARNDSMLFIPEDTDICIKADFDQIWTSSWHDLVLKAFSEGYNEISGPILNYDEKGNLIDTTISGDVHFYSKDWKWVYPVHEQRIYSGSLPEKNVYLDGLIIEHRPDTHKGRNYDLIIENWYNEDKKKYPIKEGDAYCALYYGNQVYEHNPELGVKIYEDALLGCYFSEKDPLFSQLCINISNNKDTKEAIFYLEQAFNKGFLTRNLCNVLANHYFSIDPQRAVFYYKKALEIPQIKFWAEDDTLFNQGIIENELALLYYYEIKDYEEAYTWEKKALEASSISEEQRNLYEENMKYFTGALSLNKICIYAICKNEKENIDEWISELQNVERIVVLDTGSTDGSYEHLCELTKLHKNLFVKQNIYEDFSFATARNDCLSFARTQLYGDDNWIFIWLDLDEFLDEEQQFIIKKDWTSELDELEILSYSPDENEYLVRGKCHSSDLNWYWFSYVHERLLRKDKDNRDFILKRSKAFFTHKSKKLDSTQKESFLKEKQSLYYELNKKQHEAFPADILALRYLIWDCQNLGYKEKEKAYWKELRSLIQNDSYEYKTCDPEDCYISTLITELFMKMIEFNMQELDEYVSWIEIKSKESSDLRCGRLYYLLGDYYFDKNYLQSIFYYIQSLICIENKKWKNSWIEYKVPREEVFKKLQSLMLENRDSLENYFSILGRS